MSGKQQDRRQLEPWKIRMICSKLLSPIPGVRETARHLGLSTNTIISIRAKMTALGYSKPEELTALSDDEIISRFYPNSCHSSVVKPNEVDKNNKYVPDFLYLAKDMLERKKTVGEIYEEYRELAFKTTSEPFSKGYFSRRIASEVKDLTAHDNFYLAQDFKYGETIQIDFTGDTYDLMTYNGQIKCWIMVITWPASYYTYAEFVTGQTTAESCRVISNAIRYWGNRIPLVAVTDNAKAFVITHKGSHVELNASFADFMSRLSICVDAAPVRKPQVKSCCEYEVMQVQNLCKRNELVSSFSKKATIDEHSKFLQENVEKVINEGPFRKSIEKTRGFLFRTYELPAARCASEIPPYAQEYTSVVVPRSYLITVKEHEYSVPYTYIKESVDVFINNDTIVVKYKGKEIARHLRDDKPGRTCDPAHMPPEHKSIALNNELMGSQEKIIKMASEFSPELLRFCNAKFMVTESEHANKANAIKTCQGVISFYVKNSNKDLVNLSLLEMLKCPPKMWNTPCLKTIFLNKCNEYFENQKKPQQAPAQIVRATSAQAHLRDYKGADAINGSFSSNTSFSTTFSTQSDEDQLN